MKTMNNTILLSGSLLLAALLTAACSAPPTSVEKDELVFQVCLRDKSMAAIKQLDLTTVRADKRETEAMLPVGMSIKDQPIFEAIAGRLATVKTTVLSPDKSTWYGFNPPLDVRTDIWSDWQAADYVTRAADPAYKLRHDLDVEKQAGGTEAVKIRYRVMRYRDVLASHALRKIELRHTDFVPC